MARRDFWARGVPFVWGSSAMVVLALLLLAGMLSLIIAKGLSHFWPQELHLISTRGGEMFLAEVAGTQSTGPDGATAGRRTKYKIGSRDVYGLDFRWIDDTLLVGRSKPDSALALERTTHGDMFGFLAAIRDEHGPVAMTAADGKQSLDRVQKTARHTADQIESLEEQIAGLYRPLNNLDKRLTAARLPDRLAAPDGPEQASTLARRADSTRAEIEPVVRDLQRQIETLRALDRQRAATIRLADGSHHDVPLSEIVRAWQPNRMSWSAKSVQYTVGLWTFVTQWPREANTGGGIFPAIFGTMLMVLLMTVAVVPLGVVAALYLHEYARDNWFVRAVRLAVNNLAGVPSIVFGVFGLGFFIYFVGAGIDRAFFSDYLPSPTFGTGGILWASLTLALLTVPVVIVATEEGLAAVPRAYRDGALALGATRFQTIRKIVLPYAMPGILTGVILAISRGAGEVAPLMLTGVVPLVSGLPVDTQLPWLHLERKFMHLGFHIYDVGFQSPNVEAVKPLVYSTTLVLIALVVLLNTLAIILRNRLRRQSAGASV